MIEQRPKVTGNYFWSGFALPLDDSKIIASRHIVLLCVSPIEDNTTLLIKNPHLKYQHGLLHICLITPLKPSKTGHNTSIQRFNVRLSIVNCQYSMLKTFVTGFKNYTIRIAPSKRITSAFK